MQLITMKTKRENKGHYSPGVLSNGNLYISGQLSLDPDTGELPAGGIEAHIQQALQNLDRVLLAAGLDRSSVVMSRVYVTDIAHWDAVNTAYRAFFGDHKPARAIVTVPAIHFGCLAEIEAVAELQS